MTFSDKVKIEIVSTQDDIDQRGLVAGFARGNLSLTVSGKRTGLVMTTDLSEVASFIFSKLLFLGAELNSENEKSFNSGKVYNLTMQGESAKDFLERNEIVHFSGDKLVEICEKVPSFVLSSEEIAKGYLIGVFLSAGSVFVPHEEEGHLYQLEFSFTSQGFARDFVDFLSEIGFKCKYADRKETALVYVKDSEIISDMLAYMGAFEAMLSVQSVKVYRSVRNKENRISNCEIGNIGKTVDAAQRQITAIMKLKEQDKFNLLPDKLKETAELRLQRPEDKLEALADLLGISKSCINHRLRKIVSIAEEKE